jgi:DNA-binding response OmpR family regulator
MIVLIVEDEALVGLVLETALRLAGHRVLGPAFTADEALRLVDAERPELALVDINLQGDRDGVASARALRDRHGTACLFLTAQTGQAHAADDAAIGLIGKPYDPAAVVRAIEALARIRSGEPLRRLPPQLVLFH